MGTYAAGEANPQRALCTQKITRRRAEKVQRLLRVSVSVEIVPVGVSQPQRERYKASEAGVFWGSCILDHFD